MNKIEVKVVVGANWGDEGKGLATRYFSLDAKNRGLKCLNVLYNGGSQRGHTVDFKGCVSHVCHHIGSGSFDGADTYFDRDFMVNPMTFAQEVKGLDLDTKFFISPSCRVVTPYDMIINQIVELNRGNNRHGSCGQGIWETQQRYKRTVYSCGYCYMADLCDEFLDEYLNDIACEYVEFRLHEYGIEKIPPEYMELIHSSELRKHYIEDFNYMKSMCDVVESGRHLFSQYDSIVFEGGQGLALDERNKEEYPHVTASETGSVVPVCCILDTHLNAAIEICYVTRTYLTKHGAGAFGNECSKEEVAAGLFDRTNEPNEWQGKIRYAPFNSSVYTRIRKDFDRHSAANFRNINAKIFVTHANFENGYNLETNVADYLSKTKYAEDVIAIHGDKE